MNDLDAMRAWGDAIDASKVGQFGPLMGYDLIVRESEFGSQLPFLSPDEAEKYGFNAWMAETEPDERTQEQMEALKIAWLEIL